MIRLREYTSLSPSTVDSVRSMLGWVRSMLGWVRSIVTATAGALNGEGGVVVEGDSTDTCKTNIFEFQSEQAC